MSLVRKIRPAIIPLLKLRVWLLERLKPNEMQVTLLWAAVVGFIGALGTVAFREGIQLVEWLISHHTGSLVLTASELSWWARLLSPVAGGLIAGLILQFGTRLARGQSSGDYMEVISIGTGHISARTTLIKSASSLFSVGSGESIGREGSMVQLAAMLGSLFGRSLRSLSPPQLRLLVACGAASGVASAYNAPIGGALFVSEIILGSIAMETLGPLIVASVVGNVTIHHFLGYKPIYEMPTVHIVSNWELILYVILGLVAGALAPQMLWLLDKSKGWFARLSLPIYAKMLLGGLIVGLLSLGWPEVWGNGYSVVNEILHTNWQWSFLLAVLVFKVIATAATFGSGAVGGVFTPTLFVGAVLGTLFGQAVHALWPTVTATPSTYTVVGMGAFLAGATHAPLMSILMVFEMTSNYQIVLPLMLSCATGYYTARAYREEGLYSESVRRKRAEEPAPDVRDMRVKDLIKPNVLTVRSDVPFSEVAELFAVNRFNHIFVVDEHNRLLGVISLHDIKPFLTGVRPVEKQRAFDVMRPDMTALTGETTLAQALGAFLNYSGERLPVVDASRKLLGVVTKTDVLLTFSEGEGIKATR